MVDLPAGPRDPLRFLRRHETGLFLAIVLVIGLTTLFDSQHNYWRDPRTNGVQIMRQTSLLGIFALGSAIVIISGGIDLSSGSVICFSGTICATLLLLLAPERMRGGEAPIEPEPARAGEDDQESYDRNNGGLQDRHRPGPHDQREG